MITSIFLSVSCLLLENSVYFFLNNDKYKLDNSIFILNFFSGFIGIIIFISLFSIFSALNLNLNLKKKQFHLLYILGFSNNKIKLYVFLEIILISIVIIVLSLLVANPLSELIVNYLKSVNVLDKKFYIYKKYEYQYIYVLGILLFIIFITFIATKNLNNLSNKKIHNKKFKNVYSYISFIVGLVFLLIPLALVLNKNIMQSETGKGLLIDCLISYIVGLGIISKLLIKNLLKIIYLKSKKYFIKLLFANLNKSLDKIYYSIILLTISLIFSFYTIAFNFNDFNNINQKAISLFILIIIYFYTFLIYLNSIFLYILDQKSNVKLLNIIVYTKNRLILMIFFSILISNLISLIFSIFGFLFYISVYSYWNNDAIIDNLYINNFLYIIFSSIILSILINHVLIKIIIFKA
ncbi:FtsX-like permease family protein [Spiroplasma tabanidicola]